PQSPPKSAISSTCEYAPHSPPPRSQSPPLSPPRPISSSAHNSAHSSSHPSPPPYKESPPPANHSHSWQYRLRSSPTRPSNPLSAPSESTTSIHVAPAAANCFAVSMGSTS